MWSPADTARVLIVDRDDDTRRMYAEYFHGLHWRTEEASDGREALAKALVDPPDLVTTETWLPGMSGFELCEVLRSDRATRDIPIIVVTADGCPEHLEQVERLGATVLIKPCLPEVLVAAATRLVAQYRAPSQPLDGKGFSPARPARATLDSRVPPRALHCPECHTRLVFDRTHLGGVNPRHPEQWDYFTCPRGCGTFQYRLRTRKIRKVS
jgi:CheY-like chemotaxis protein